MYASVLRRVHRREKFPIQYVSARRTVTVLLKIFLPLTFLTVRVCGITSYSAFEGGKRVLRRDHCSRNLRQVQNIQLSCVPSGEKKEKKRDARCRSPANLVIFPRPLWSFSPTCNSLSLLRRSFGITFHLISTIETVRASTFNCPSSRSYTRKGSRRSERFSNKDLLSTSA